MKKNSFTDVKTLLDKWVSGVGTKRYIPSNYVDNLDISLSMTENFAIQQVKEEIYEFIRIILKKKKNNNCLEKGFGGYGNNHFL